MVSTLSHGTCYSLARGAASQRGHHLLGRPAIAAPDLDHAPVGANHGRGERVVEQHAVALDVDGEGAGETGDLGGRAGHELPARRVGPHRLRVGLQHRGRVERRVQCHREQAHVVEVRVGGDDALHLLEPLHHQRAELGYGAAREDERQGGDLAAQVARRERRPACVTSARSGRASPLRTRALDGAAGPRRALATASSRPTTSNAGREHRVAGDLQREAHAITGAHGGDRVTRRERERHGHRGHVAGDLLVRHHHAGRRPGLR